MKRIISIIILTVIALSMAAPAMASECYYYDSYGEHAYAQDSFSYPTCTEPGYVNIKCTVCGDTMREETGDAYGHTWELVSETAATCTENGVTSFYCIECGESRSEKTKAVGHNWKVQETINEATCISSGTEKVKCSRCNKTTTRETETTSHKYGAWGIAQEATDNAKGLRTRACTYCGKTQKEEYYPEGTLYRGIKGEKEKVELLQTMLTDCGYLNDTIDGIFGKKTEQAVKDFQSVAGVAVDGIAWPQSNVMLEAEWRELKGINVKAPVQETEPAASGSSCCTRIENENGVVEIAYCADHLILMNAVNVLFEPEDTEQMRINALRLVRQMYQEEVEMLYARWLEVSSEEEQAGVMGAQAMFIGYLNSQEMVWNKQYGENSGEALKKINDMLHDQMLELCAIIDLSSVG